MQQENLKNAFLDSVMGHDPYEDAYYQEENDITVEDGTYPAIIIDLSKQDIITRKNAHADLYKPTYRIAKGKYSGCLVTDKGIWRFRSNPSRHHNKSSRGNIIYKNVLDILGIPLETVSVKGMELKRLPELSIDNVEGKPVLINVQDDDYKSSYGRLANKVATLHSEWTDGSTVSEEPKSY